jgi:hypothetical protein
VFLNGTLSNDRVTSATIKEHEDSRILLPGDVLNISLTGDLNGTDIKIITANGFSLYG